MKLNLACIAASAGVFGATATQVEVTPVQKVVQLLGGMLEKGKKSKKEEEVAFATSSGFCADTASIKTAAITDGKENIGQLTATINKAAADVTKLGRQIAKLQADESTYAADIKAANGVRAIEKADYDTGRKDYTESIDAVGRAITTLKAKAGNTAQASALVQVTALKELYLIPDSAKSALKVFLQHSNDDGENLLVADMAAPEANGYEAASGGVVDMLTKLQGKFVEEKTTLETNEKNAKNSFSLLTQNLKAQSDNAIKIVADKQVLLARRSATKSEKSGDKNDAAKALADDEKYLKTLKADCSAQKSDFESSQKLRSEEIVALEKATRVLSSGAVAGAAEKHLPKLLLQKQATALPALRTDSNEATKRQHRVSEFLQAQADQLNSRILAAVAQHVAADPMKKVKKMIQDMLVKLTEQAGNEADHKGQCDTQLASNKATRQEKTNVVETLTAEIEGLSAKMAKLSTAIKTNTEQITALDAASAAKTAIRLAESATNKATIVDAQQAQEAVAQALVVLKEFYATSFLQTGAGPGMQGESQGVIGMIEVIESDFSRLEAETKASEGTEKKKYEEFTEDTKVDKAAKQADTEHKTEQQAKAQHDKTVAEGDLEDNQKSLDAALAFFEKLKPDCLAPPMSYEDRVARRKAEVSNLKDALKMLEADAN